MSPVVLLFVFCAVMSAVAVARVVLEDDRDRVDGGTALVVCGITALAGVWVALEEAWLSTGLRLLFAGTGVALIGIGLTLIVRHWDEPTSEQNPNEHASATDHDATTSVDRTNRNN